MPTKNKLLLRQFLCPRAGVVAEFVFVNAAAAAAAAAFDTTHQATSKKIMVDDDEND
jgi:hypothetical protein